MWPEGYEAGDEDLIDDVSNRFALCALHQAKIIRERWKYWSGSVPASVSIRLHRLESLLSINQEGVQQRSRSEMVQADRQSMKASSNNYQKETSEMPLERAPKTKSSQPFLAEIRSYPVNDKYFKEQMEPKQNIVIQGPDIPRMVSHKRRAHFWCCH